MNTCMCDVVYLSLCLQLQVCLQDVFRLRELPSCFRAVQQHAAALLHPAPDLRTDLL